MKNKERGITLIALIITVIILLILAGVAISSLGNSGLFSKSKDAVNKYSEAQKNEEEELANYLNEMNSWNTGGNSGGGVVSEIQPGEIATENKKYKDENGDMATIPKDFIISTDTGEQTIDEGLVIKDSVGNEWVWIPVNSATYPMYEYNSSESRNVGKLYAFAGNTPTATAQTPTGYREPDVVTNYDGGVQDPVGITKEKLQNEFDEMVASVNKNGGYYIGRYETGDLSKEKVVLQKGNTDIGGQTWYKMYEKGRSMYDTSSSVQANIIWGSQWDQAMLFMKDVKNVVDPAKYYITDSTGMGNYGGSKLATGQYAVKNVYDMAGNMFDWTMEANDTRSRVLRGGHWNDTGVPYPASNRHNTYPVHSYSHYGVRLQLYIR